MGLIDDLKAAIDRVEQAKPVQYYVASDHIPQGKVLQVAAHGAYPAYMIFNPADFEQQRAELARRVRLVDYRTWRMTPEQIAQEAADYLAELQKMPLIKYRSLTHGSFLHSGESSS